MVFPLVNVALLAQLLFLLLLSRHQRPVLGILGLQRGDQPRLLRQGLLLFARLLSHQIQPMRQQRAISDQADGGQQQQQQPPLRQPAYPGAHTG